MSKESLQLPKTAFSMKANLPNKEPKIIDQWEKNNLYKKLRKKLKEKKIYSARWPTICKWSYTYGYGLK